MTMHRANSPRPPKRCVKSAYRSFGCCLTTTPAPALLAEWVRDARRRTLDLVADRSIRSADVVVTLNVRGTLSQPFVTISSEPPLPEAEALLLENNLIKSLAPRYNILFRDDKSYPYIVLTRDEYPRLGFFRGNPDRKAEYFGPYPSSWAVRDSIHLLQKMFRLRTCEDSVFANRSRPCLLYQIKRCSGPCVGHIAPEEYAADVQLASLFLNGRQQEVTGRLTRAMESAAERLAYEQAAVYRDQIQSLRQVQEKQYVSSSKGEDIDIIVALRESGQLCVNLAMVRGGRHLGDRPQFPVNAGDSSLSEAVAAFIRQHYAAHPAPARIIASPLPEAEEGSDIGQLLAELAGRAVPIGEPRSVLHRAWTDMALQNGRLAIVARNQATAQQEQRLQALQQVLALPDNIHRIECFDISNTQGTNSVASMVVFVNGIPRKSDYRKFNIKTVAGPNDFESMREALTRRFRRYFDAKAAERQPGQKIDPSFSLVPDLLIIDDFGLSSLTPIQAEDFYEIVAERHLKSSIVMTSNRPPQDWVPLFPDPMMANSALDRLAHHAHHIIMEGDSYRRKLSPKSSTPSTPKGGN